MIAKTRFTDEEIKARLIKITDDATEKCTKDFQKLRSEKGQGLERVFEEAFIEAANFPGWEICHQVPRGSFGAKYMFRPKGKVDCLVTHDNGHRIAIEFKVCEFPRTKRTSPSGALYDVGQLSWDYGDLKAYGLDSAYCIVVLHGALAEIQHAKAFDVARLFHNSMFIDFQTSKLWGELRPKGLSAQRKQQIATIQEMGFGRPYYKPDTNKNNFCRLYEAQGMAVIGFSTK